MWAKWRHRYADGPGEWSWCYLGERANDAATKKYVQDNLVPEWKESGECWSEHYRGVTFELVEKAPREVITEKIKNAESRIEWAAKDLRTLINLLKWAEDTDAG